MAFSMHSHSGQFCPGHAKDTLEEVVQTAIARGMIVLGLTEHMPRNSEKDLYPEEIAAHQTIATHPANHQAYLHEAVRLRSKYSPQISLLLAFEAEFIRSSYGPFVLSFASDPRIDYFIGSVHHVHEIPIDYDTPTYLRAVEASDGREEGLFEDYFDLQFQMLEALRPRVVGHFDLIRLLATEKKDRDLKEWRGVWEKVVRNLKLIVEQGGLMECNSAGLRKGLEEPYPRGEIVREFLGMGGKLTLSDDSHGVEHVGTNYGKMVGWLEGLGVSEVWTLSGKGEDGRGAVEVKRVELGEVKRTFRP